MKSSHTVRQPTVVVGIVNQVIQPEWFCGQTVSQVSGPETDRPEAYIRCRQRCCYQRHRHCLLGLSTSVSYYYKLLHLA